MDLSARFSLPYLLPNQAQKHVTFNEALRALDQMVQLSVKSQTTGVQPSSPTEGDAYILPPGVSGTEWVALTAGHVAAFQDGAWVAYPPVEGMRAYVKDEGGLALFDGAGWVALAGGTETLSLLGVNTAADTTNRLAVKSDAVLFHHDDVTPGSGDSRIVIDKDADGSTASLLFQAGASGRAEIGLTGDNDFHFKVSPDGASWVDAITVDKDTGYAGFGTVSPEVPFHVNAGPANVAFRLQGTDPTVVFQIMDDTTLATGNGPIFFLRTGDNAQFYTSGSARMTIDPAGQVGIGLSSPTARLHVIGGGVVSGAPAGGDRGAGTINAEAVYDDNALLSCYVLDQALDGSVDLAKWDARTPDRDMPELRELDPQTNEHRIVSPASRKVRLHQPARKFAARIGGAYDPLTLDGYARHWTEKRHLSSMPNESGFDPVADQLTIGEWVQRLVETVEIHAVLIEELNQALKGRSSGRPA